MRQIVEIPKDLTPSDIADFSLELEEFLKSGLWRRVIEPGLEKEAISQLRAVRAHRTIGQSEATIHANGMLDALEQMQDVFGLRRRLLERAEELAGA